MDLSIRINGIRISTLKYANNTVILAKSIEDLQRLLNQISTASQRAGLSINIDKTKLMVFNRQNHDLTSLHLDSTQIERVNSIKYLGCQITKDLDPDWEIKCRIEYACTVFNKMRSFFCDDDLNLKLRQRMAKCYVWSVLLYVVEAWHPQNRHNESSSSLWNVDVQTQASNLLGWQGVQHWNIGESARAVQTTNRHQM